MMIPLLYSVRSLSMNAIVRIINVILIGRPNRGVTTLDRGYCDCNSNKLFDEWTPYSRHHLTITSTIYYKHWASYYDDRLGLVYDSYYVFPRLATHLSSPAMCRVSFGVWVVITYIILSDTPFLVFYHVMLCFFIPDNIIESYPCSKYGFLQEYGLWDVMLMWKIPCRINQPTRE
jgi:hypothetical protein